MAEVMPGWGGTIDGWDRQFPGDVGAVQRARASKGDESEVTRIIAAANGD